MWGAGTSARGCSSHVGDNNPAITAQRPTHFVAVVTQSDVVTERQLILELNPVANQKVG